MVGDHVWFNGKEYIIVYIYSNGYCELKEKHNKYHYELATLSELKKMNNTPTSII